MGKSLVIKGADFSANALERSSILDITSYAANYFVPRYSLGAFSQVEHLNANNARCCVKAFLFSEIGVDISQYQKIEVTVKSGFDYVFGTGPTLQMTVGSETGWQGWSGETGGQSFAWVTGNQKGVATVDATTLAMSLNLRYDNNTTTFSTTTILTDIVESIILIRSEN